MNQLIHLQNLNSVKRETTHAGDTETLIENQHEIVVTDDYEMAIIGDEDCVGDPEFANFDITLNCENLELSEHVSNVSKNLSPSQQWSSNLNDTEICRGSTPQLIMETNHTHMQKSGRELI